MTLRLTLGTKKFPNVEFYSQFINDNGGSSNAYTDQGTTVYHFDVKNDSFDEALDIFSQFYKEPLIDENFVNKEMNAVDSEHSKNILNDGRRAFWLFKKSANPDSPFSNFSTGNLETLNVPDTYKRLREFYENFYR